MIIRQRGTRYYAVIRKDGHERWYGGSTPEEAMQNAGMQKMTLQQFSTYYIRNISVKQKTAEVYWHALKSLYTTVDKPLSELSTIDIQNWVSNLKGSSRTKRDYFAAVRTALRQAVKWGLIPVSPHEGVTVPRAPRSVGQAYTREQVQVLLDTDMRMPIALGALCGMRISEICGLRVSRVHDGYVVIDAQLQRVHALRDGDILLRVPITGKRKWALVPPKTTTSNGSVAVPAFVTNELKSIVRNDKYRTDLVFLHDNGHPYDPRWVLERFKRLCRKNGIPVYRFHDLRHTAATLLLTAGVDPLTVQHALRHSDVTTTQNLYQHLTDELRIQPAKIFSEMFTYDGQVGKTVGNEHKKRAGADTFDVPETRFASGLKIWSGRRDSNSRPLVPETSALPNCATPRQHAHYR